MAELKWKKLNHNYRTGRFLRAKVPGGWLIWLASNGEGGITFVPDPNHEWE